jgi:hypothetical protein
MGNRQAIRGFLTLSVAAGVVALCGSPVASAQMAVRHPGGAATEASAELTVTWVFRGVDLFACETVAYDLRRVIAEHGARVDVRAIGIDADDELVASFLRKERLPIRVAPYTDAQYRLAFGTPSSPAVFITRGGQPVRSLFASTAPQAREVSSLGLYDLVSHLLAPPARTVARAQ